MAFGSFLEGDVEAVVGRDSRLSGPILKNAMVAGMMATGRNCADIGIAPTPLVYFASLHYGTRAGVAITASHNPPEYNGFKLCRGGVSYTYETAIRKIEETVKSNACTMAGWDKVGRLRTWDVTSDYVEYLTKRGRLERGMKVVLDVGNGACGFAGQIFENLGCKVDVLFAEPDGRFPHHMPDPLQDETLTTLRRTVLERDADLGIAFDGDGDRVGFVDDKGQIVKQDSAFILFTRDALKRHPRSKIIFNVLSSKALVEDIVAHEGVPVMSRVGHSYIQEMLLREQATLGGELSGHFYFGREYYGFDDAMFAGMKMVEFLSKTDMKLSQLVDKLPTYPSSPETRIRCPDDKKSIVVETLKRRFQGEGYRIIDIDGVRVEFEDGWGIVRASNTEPSLVLRFEATTQGRLKEIEHLISREVKKALKEILT